jgi:phage baseplate assembly protein W
MQNRNPLPINWPLFTVPDANGELRYPSLEASVRQAIRIILSTRPGEQLMRPEFGAGLEDFVHESNTLTTRRRIYDRITEALARWESRILLDRVDVSEVSGQPTQVRVEILYRLRRTGAPQQMGLTMDLEA